MLLNTLLMPEALSNQKMAPIHDKNMDNLLFLTTILITIIYNNQCSSKSTAETNRSSSQAPPNTPSPSSSPKSNLPPPHPKPSCKKPKTHTTTSPISNRPSISFSSTSISTPKITKPSISAESHACN